MLCVAINQSNFMGSLEVMLSSKAKLKGLEMWQCYLNNRKVVSSAKASNASLANTKLSMTILIFVEKTLLSEKTGGRSWNSILAVIISEDRF